jgi:predicted MFS family arabinose efflux permease
MPKSSSNASKLRRIDFLGAILLAATIVAFLLGINLASNRLTVWDPSVLGLGLLFAGSSLLFILVEANYAVEPIFPLRLLIQRDVLVAYLIIGFMLASQINVRHPPSLMGSSGTDSRTQLLCSVVLYFRVTERASNTVASLHLVPTVIGNTVGALLAGAIIKRFGHHFPCSTIYDIEEVLAADERPP